MILDIAQLGQPILRLQAEDIPIDIIRTEPVQQFIDAMLETVQTAGGVGLAGPQVFSKKRIFVAGVLPPLEEDAPPQMEVLINPKITALSDEVSLSWEGCLSFIELLALVPRCKKIRVEFFNRHAEPQSMELDDFPSRIVQHEFDHLEGILTIDRAPSPRYIIKASELEAAQAELEDFGLQ